MLWDSDKGMKGTKKGYMDEPVSEFETDHTSYCSNLLVLCVFGFLDPAVTLKPSLTVPRINLLVYYLNKLVCHGVISNRSQA